MKSCFLTVIIFQLLVSGLSSIAQTDNWIPTKGPYGGTVSTISRVVDDYYAVSSRGHLYKSTNKGQEWIPTKFTGLIPHLIYPKDESTIFATCWADGNNNNYIYRSVDNMNTWENKSLNLGVNTTYNIVFGSDDVIYACTKLGVYTSTNNGDSWEHAYSIQEDENKSVFCIAFNSQGTIFIGTGNTVCRTTDNGASWEKLTLLPENQSSSIKVLIINSRDEVFAAGSKGIFRSYDNGNTWEQLDNGPMKINTEFLLLRGENELIAGQYFGDNGGVYYSSDNGDSWEKVRDEQCNSAALTDENEILATSKSGILFSDDWNSNWVFQNKGIMNLGIKEIIINKNEGDHKGDIFIGTDGKRIYRSTDEGNTWELLYQISQGGAISSLVINSNDEIFVSCSWGGGIFKSSDNGTSWTSINNGINDLDISSLVIDKDGNMFAGSYTEIYKSTDMGNSWTVSLSKDYAIECNDLIVNSKNWIIAASFADDILVSKDGGENWIQKNTGMVNQGGDCLAINIKDEVYVVTYNFDLYFSDNDCENWSLSKAGMGIRKVYCLNENEILAAATITHNDFGIYRSSDKGKNWQPYKTGVSGNYVHCFDSDADGFVYIGSSGGVYKSNSGITGIEVIVGTQNSLNIYPNPATSFISINELKDSPAVYIITNILGVPILSGELEQTNSIIDIRGMPTGAYLLKIGNKSYRIIKE